MAFKRRKISKNFGERPEMTFKLPGKRDESRQESSQKNNNHSKDTLEEDLEFLTNSRRKTSSTQSKMAYAKQVLQKIESDKVVGKVEDKTIPSSGLKTCNCKRSKCLKLYCECFANNRFCGPECSCCGCSNDVEHEEDRIFSKEQILIRNPLAFQPKI